MRLGRRGCWWAVWLLLVVGLCAFAGLGRLADGAESLHSAEYQTPWYPGGLLGLLCLALPATAGGLMLGFWRGRRPPKVTEEDLRALEGSSPAEGQG